MRDRLLSLIYEIEDLVNALLPRMEGVESNVHVKGPEWELLKEDVTEIFRLVLIGCNSSIGPMASPFNA